MKKSRTFRKSFVAAIAALCLAAPLAVMPVQVETSYAADATYSAYQIFKGTLANDSLGNIEWGADVSLTTEEETALLEALKNESNYFAGCTTAKSIAEVLSTGDTEADKEAKAKIFASVVEKYIDGVGDTMAVGQASNVRDGAGYYLVKTESDGNAKTRYILEVTGDTIKIEPKTATPTVVKKVQENTDITESYGSYTNYNDVADYNIGDSVPFLLEASLSENNEGFSEYSAYYLKFNDTLSKGFVAPSADDISIYVVNNTTEISVKANLYNIHKDITPGSDGPTQIAITIEDIKKLTPEGGEGYISVTADSKIVVKYNAKLDADATIGLGGNENSVNLEYSNNPNVSYNPTTDRAKDNTEGDKSDDENETVDENETTPESPDVTDNNGDTTEDNTGKTKDDTVIVFTYELDITKKLQNIAGNTEESNYTLADASDPAGFEIYSGTGENKKVARVTKTTDGTYRITAWDLATEQVNGQTYQMENDGSGLIKIIGLDEGTYQIVETKTPNGYNTVDPIDIVITANTLEGDNDNRQAWDEVASNALKELSITVGGTTKKVNCEQGIVDMSVKNNRGSSLPSTGGIGTTIFYLGGGTMAAVAGVYLITKKRMKNEEDDEI